MAKVVAFNGDVTVFNGKTPPRAASIDMILCPEDQIRTGDNSGVDLRFDARDSVIDISSNTTVAIGRADEPDITLENGLMRFISSVRGHFRIRTPHTDAGIDGTEAMLAVSGPNQDTLVLVREGVVSVADRRDQGRQLALKAGQASFASTKTRLIPATPQNVPIKFRPYLLHPDGAADWAVYYPPILLGTDIKSPIIQKGGQRLAADDPDGADAILQAVSPDDPDIAAALAMRAIIALYRNDTEKGAALANGAVAANPDLAASHIAKSYAEQAQGHLDDARDAAHRATQAAPEDSYAWARLAELELTIGHRDDARMAIDRALAIEETALGRAIAGFIALGDGKFSDAYQYFNQAIKLDSEAPLGHLGLGLSLIRSGHEDQGRREIETATALDPQRASLRNWLGRAYFAEDMQEKAASQYSLSMEMDPDDPTPHLFSAQERFSANQPNSALRALDHAQTLNNRRFAVRSHSGLAEDDAVRGVSFGRIYDTLDFDLQAQQAGANATAIAPTNPGAHRFLADIYRARPGYQIAQTSELLVAQLLQPPTKNPIQPRLSEPRLALLNTTGQTRTTFQEFAPLFDSNGFYGIASGALGNQATREDEVSLSYLHNNLSVAFGQFHTETDGFRPNDDLRYDIVSLEAKARIIPALTLTAEYRFRDSEEGDRFLRSFNDPSNLRTRTDIQNHLFTLGGHAEITPNNDLLFFTSGVLNDQDTRSSFFTGTPPVQFIDQTKGNSHGAAMEIQDIQQFDWGNILIGGLGSLTRGDIDLTFSATPTTLRNDLDQVAGYIYGRFDLDKTLQLTLGLSIDHIDQDQTVPGFDASFNQILIPRNIKKTQVNPKVGLRWQPLPGLVLRGAYARTLKRDLIQDRSLEPTTIAGFNQFFDDFTATDTHMLGAGSDIRLTDAIWIGGEYIYRDLDTPNFTTSTTTFAPTVPILRDGDEHIVRGYLNAIWGDGWSGSLGVEYNRNKTEILDRPDKVKTWLAPARLKYFDKSGFFGGVEAVYFHQRSVGDVQSTSLLNVSTDEQGVILNASVGYRFANSRGIAALEINNLLDKDFALQNNLNNSARPTTRPLAEGFNIVGQITIGF